MKKDPRGRKKVKDKKQAVTIYVPESVIKENGGKKKLREKLLSATN